MAVMVCVSRFSEHINILNQKITFLKVGLKLIRLNTTCRICVYVVVYTNVLLWEIGQIITSCRTISSVLTNPLFSHARTEWTNLVCMC